MNLTRIAHWVMDREERFAWNPRWLRCWAFDYILARGTPVTFKVRPLIEVNPQPKTWASGSSISITYTNTWETP